MPLSDYYNGTNTHRNHNHTLHSLPMAENDGKKSVRTFFDFSQANAPENVEAKYSLLLFLTHLRHMSNFRLVRFLLGLTLTFLIMASYVLMWDKRGLFFASPPYQIRSVPFRTSTATVEVSPVKNALDMRRLVTTISSKLQYTPRKVPDEKDIKETDSHLFSVIPHQFRSDIKSPCWYEEFSLQPEPDPYARNLFTQRSKPFKAVCEKLRTNFTQHLLHRDGKHFRLRCLPYFYIIGQPKCGTTDLFHRLLLHPEVQFNIMKEPHWWTRKRFGYIRFKDGFQESFPVEDYLDLFDLTARQIQVGINGNSSGDQSAVQFITGEASASTMWDNQAWSYVQTGREEEEEEEEDDPPFLAQDFIHTVQPDAKIIIMLRDPGERLYSDYLYFKMANKSAEDFHEKVVESMLLFQSCLFERSLRSCAYDSGLSNGMPVRLNLGLYIVFLLDWLTVFHREQILILRLEDYAANLKGTIKKIFDFLGVGRLSEQMETILTRRPMSNTRRAADRNLGPMLPVTRTLLRQFHRPFNLKLASELDNRDFLWSNSKGQ